MSDFAKVEQSLREEMTRIASSFFQRGYATGSAGNLSLLLPDGNLLATPTGSCLGNLDPQRLSKVTADGEWLSGDKPSKEVLFHLALYRNNPRCKAVVHCTAHGRRRFPACKGWTAATLFVRSHHTW